jgi:hypothetical protein
VSPDQLLPEDRLDFAERVPLQERQRGRPKQGDVP